MSLSLKVLWPSSWLAQTKPWRFSVNPVLFNPYWLTMIDELYLHSYANEPNKSPGRERLWALLPLRETATFPPQADHVLGSLFLHPWRTGGGGAALKPPDTWLLLNIAHLWLYVLANSLFYYKTGIRRPHWQINYFLIRVQSQTLYHAWHIISAYNWLQFCLTSAHV